ncbi:hypothetical protein BGZ63DRAFT_393785 [Mariannaea sp. PMI_226]|nr:hypothetical protein BGZ63DRAFT_393785 [Mariannaea sp. PMI_226]
MHRPLQPQHGLIRNINALVPEDPWHFVSTETGAIHLISLCVRPRPNSALSPSSYGFQRRARHYGSHTGPFYFAAAAVCGRAKPPAGYPTLMVQSLTAKPQHQEKTPKFPPKKHQKKNTSSPRTQTEFPNSYKIWGCLPNPHSRKQSGKFSYVVVS